MPHPRRRKINYLFEHYKKLAGEHEAVVSQITDLLVDNMGDQATTMPEEKLTDLITEQAAFLCARWRRDEANQGERMRDATPLDRLLDAEHRLALEIMETEALLLDAHVDATTATQH